ncbi:hypothetical protein B0I37DRAFT_407190 [Chaetomium sp. MPI-CAGE-AT-0009]|nr:hypothetical protein B0I37DRAFT_407190 [Chaetomium sp. MPI-CAGE-AT-0009]
MGLIARGSICCILGNVHTRPPTDRQRGNKSVVNGHVIDAIGKSRDAIRYPKAHGGQHYVGIEIFHQMCSLRVDHGIDMLRQALLCQGDVGLTTANWVEPAGMIYPDYSTKHKCRDFD